MIIEKIEQVFGKNSKNKLEYITNPNYEGALSALETFYYSFNNKDINVFTQIWQEDDLIQLNNPLGGILRGKEQIIKLYDKIFNGNADVWVELSNIVAFQSSDVLIFAGEENGKYIIDNNIINLKIRTSRVFNYNGSSWKQIHHHGSIDNPHLLEKYQNAVN